MLADFPLSLAARLGTMPGLYNEVVQRRNLG